MITYLNQLGLSATRSGGLMLLQTAVLVGALLLLEVLLRRRLGAALRYSLWLLVIFKVLLPPSLVVPTGVGYWLGRWLIPPVVLAAPTPLRVTAEEVEPTLLPSEIEPVALPLPLPPTLQTSGRLLLAWVAGSVGLALWMGRRHREIQRLVNSADLAPAVLREATRAAAKELGLSRVPELRLTKFNHSPAVCGLFRPVVLLPDALARELRAEALHDVLLHELAHVQRRDLWFNLLQAVVQVVWWWNPLVWFANGRIRALRELAVDERVMLLQSGVSASYPATLVEVARHCTAHPALALSFVGILESRRALRDRVERLLTLPLPRRAALGWSGWLTVICAALLGLPMAFARRVEVAAPPTDSAIAALKWSPWSPDAVKAARQNGSPVLVDFTADWCVSCQATRQTVLNSPEVISKLQSLGAVALVADLTHANPALEAELKALGRGGVPALVFYPKESKDEPLLFSEVPTRASVLATLDGSKGLLHPPYAAESQTSLWAGMSPALRARYGLPTGTAFAMDPALAARYGLLPLTATSSATDPTATASAGAATEGTAQDNETKFVMSPELRQRYGLNPAPSVGNGSASTAAPEPLLTRQFRLNPNTFIAGLESVTSTPLSPSLLQSPTNGSALNALVRQFFSAAGVEFPAFQVVTNEAPSVQRKALFFNSRTGVLFVRATETDLATVEQAIQVLNVAPPQVLLETKFLEVDAAEAKAAGLGAILGNVAPDPLGARTQGSDPSGAAVSGILTDAQFRVTLKALEALGGTAILATPKVITLSGRQAQIQAVEVRSIVDPKTRTTNEVPFGPSLDVIPHVSADDLTIDLTVLASLTKFRGYAAEPPHLPIVESNTLNTHALVRDGQTLVLASAPAEPAANGTDPAHTKRKHLLVFVTPLIIDPAGQPVNKPGKP